MSTTTSLLTLIGFTCASTILILMYLGVPVPPWYVTVPGVVVLVTMLLLTIGGLLAKADKVVKQDDSELEDN